MLGVERTVFIAHSQTSQSHALVVYQRLEEYQYDVSTSSMTNSEQFEYEIKSRAHFILILAPSTFERLQNPDDWLRLQIEIAIETNRNIIPFFIGDFSWKDYLSQLTGKLKILSMYNSLVAHYDFFDEAIERLHKRFLSVPVNVVLTPKPPILKEPEIAPQKFFI
ncbi:MAG: hypothetical protein KJ043_04590, partial [Anaerolineae bacterium]|nr:hypothetical protein [Anaerolineae bacterium]